MGETNLELTKMTHGERFVCCPGATSETIMLPGTTPGSAEVRRDTGNRSETRALGKRSPERKTHVTNHGSVDVDVHSVPANS